MFRFCGLMLVVAWVVSRGQPQSHSSLAIFSATKIAPKRFASEPEYIFLIKFRIRRRSVVGLHRCDGRPALPSLSPLPPHFLITSPQTLGLPVNSAASLVSSNLSPPLATRPISSNSLQLTSAHSRSSNRMYPGWRSQFKGTFLLSYKSDIINEFQQLNVVLSYSEETSFFELI
jgi:hypothetical protein